MKVYLAMYNANTWESAARVISVHYKKEKAQEAADHCAEEGRKDWDNLWKDYPKKPIADFNSAHSWGVREMIIED